MSSPLSFSEQVSSWLRSLGFACEADNTDTFTLLRVFKDHACVLEIKLIASRKWSLPFAASAYDRYQSVQQSLRASGITSIILWQDLWESRQEIVRSRISALLGISVRIPARLTYVSRLSKDVAEDFLTSNHLLGAVSAKYRFGLYVPVRYFRVLPAACMADNQSGDLLVAEATYSNARIFTKQGNPFRSHELIRFCSLRGTTIVGGFDKLLSAFRKEFDPDDIMTYVDLEWSDGAGYQRLGFDRISEKPGMDIWLDENTNERFTEKNRPENVKLMQIKNAGSLKFVKTFKKDQKLY